MRNEVMKWIIGILTASILSLVGVVWATTQSQTQKTETRVDNLEKISQANTLDVAVIKEVLSQVNARTYEMSGQLDRIEKKQR